MKTLRAKTLRAQRVMSTKIKTSQIFPTKNTMFTANSIDFDGDGHFSGSDLGTLSNKYFFELYTIGDGHCFFRVLDRFMKRARLYTVEELRAFEKMRVKVHCGLEIFPEITYLRRIAQKFCMKIPIQKYGRNQPPSEDAMNYAALAQAFGLEKARNLQGVGSSGYADSPDYEACAVVFKIVICILQINGKWQIFPDECLQKGFGTKPIMFAYNSGGIHFNSLLPKMGAFQRRKTDIESFQEQMKRCNPTARQVCLILTYFDSRATVVDKACSYMMREFETDLDTAIEMVRVRSPVDIQKCIERERKLMHEFSDKQFSALLTYKGYKTAQSLLNYLNEKISYFQLRHQKMYTLDQVANKYLNGD